MGNSLFVSRPVGVSVIVLLLVFSTLTVASFGQTALARGFCNIDHLGNADLQKSVATASAQFLSGGSSMFLMLAAYENGARDEVNAKGEEAIIRFASSSELFVKLANDMPDAVDAALRGIDSKIVADVAWSGYDSQLFSELNKIAISKESTKNLITRCGGEAEKMANETRKFLSDLKERDRESTFSRLLSVWNQVLYVGRVISSIFAVAGGERANQ